MPYTNRIKTLEESHRLIESQIKIIETSENPNQDKLKKLTETRDKYLMQLRDLRRAQYDSEQIVNFDDDR